MVENWKKQLKVGLIIGLIYTLGTFALISLNKTNRDTNYVFEDYGVITACREPDIPRDGLPSMTLSLDDGRELVLLGYRQVVCFVGTRVKIEKKMGKLFENDLYRVSEV